MNYLRYEISILVGPCRQSEAETLCLELAEQLQGKHGELGSEFGASLAVGPWDESEGTPSQRDKALRGLLDALDADPDANHGILDAAEAEARAAISSSGHGSSSDAAIPPSGRPE